MPWCPRAHRWCDLRRTVRATWYSAFRKIGSPCCARCSAKRERCRYCCGPIGQRPLPRRCARCAASADTASRTFLVKADVGRAVVRLGQTATVRVAAPAIGNASIRAASRRRRRAAGDQCGVGARPQQHDRKPQPVQVAGADGNDVLIAGGLSEGQIVITAGTHVLTAGSEGAALSGSEGRTRIGHGALNATIRSCRPRPTADRPRARASTSRAGR